MPDDDAGSDLSSLPPVLKIEIPEDKLVGYLLNLGHPRGRSKAKFFRRHGFLPELADVMAQCLYEQAFAKGASTATAPHPGGWGITVVVTGPMRTPSGATPIVKSVWLWQPSAGSVTLVTAYPAA